MRLCIPVLNRYDLLDQLIESAERGSLKPTGYVIVDNGRRLDGKHYRARLGADRITVIRPGRNLGVAASWNLFLDLGEPIVIANDDIELFGESLARIRHAMLGGAGDLVQGFGFALFGITPRCVGEVGFFDENFFAYFEDCDYTLRAQRAGVHMYYLEPERMARHHAFASGGMEHIEPSREYFHKKWGGESSCCTPGADNSKLFTEPFNGEPPLGWSLRKSEHKPMSQSYAAHVYPIHGLQLLVPASLYQYFTEETGGMPERSLIEWARGLLKPDKLFVDVGAHIGTYSLSYAKSVRGVVAFEPGRDAYYSLCGGIVLSGANNVTAHQVALGSVGRPRGRMQPFVVPHSGGGLSTLRTDLPPGAAGAREEVLVRSLDSFGLGAEVGFIKIDVEGSELSVLRGAEGTLRSSGWPPILIEVWQEGWFEADRNAIYGWLSERGYRMTTIAGYPHMIVADRP